MKVTKAVATIEPGADDAESPNGTFHVVLSTPTKDRDGEEVKAEEWEQPLPDHITFDMDHGMTVASTVGSGTPSIETDGTLHVRGNYSSRPLAQEVRGLVNEGHIRTTSVAFLRKSVKDEKSATSTKRELLNGAFVAIPANKEAVVLASKSAEVELDEDEIGALDVKAGRRHSSGDLDLIQQIHDNALALGASAPVEGKSTVDLADAIAKRLHELTAKPVVIQIDGEVIARSSKDANESDESAAADESAAQEAADEPAAAESEDASEKTIQVARARAMAALASL